MRVAFLGFQTWGLVSLRAALDGGHDVAVVVTHPDEHEYYYSFNDSVEEFARSHGLPVVVRKGIEADIGSILHNANPEAILCSNWRRRLGPEALSAASMAAVNVHRALLPRYGGLAPINWAIARGETRTGVTVHALEEDMDLGDIFGQEEVAVAPDETATDVFHKMTPVIQRLVPQVLDDLAAGVATRRSQNPDEATFFHKRGERETRIDWRQRQENVYALIRAQSEPFPSAFTSYNGHRVDILKASRPAQAFCGTPGRLITRTPDGVVVLCGENGAAGQGLVIERIRTEAGDRLNANDYFKRLDSYLD